MKHILLTTIAAEVLVGCGKTQEDKNADLELALIEGSIEEVKAAINSGGKITYSLGCDVIVHRDNEIIKLLVDEVEKTKPNWLGDLLEFSIEIKGNLEIAEYFFDKGVQLNRERASYTLIKLLHRNYDNRKAKQLKAVQYLFKKGADLNYISPDKLTSLDVAYENNLTDIIEFLISNGAKDSSDKSIFTALRRRNFPEIKKLLKNGTATQNKAENGNSILHAAVEYGIGNNEILRLIASQGVNINAKNNDGDTALHLAAIYFHSAIKFKKTGHPAASNERIKTYAEIIKILLNEGASKKIKNNGELVPLNIVAPYHKNIVVQLANLNGELDRSVEELEIIELLEDK